MIKLQNIYYMLAYAFHVLHEDGYKKIAAEDFQHAEDLLAAILAKGISNQVKRGLGCEYISYVDMTRSLRGKINISATIKTGAIATQPHFTNDMHCTPHIRLEAMNSFPAFKKQLVCEFDEFSENTYLNQILKTTALILIRSDKVKLTRKKALKKVMLYFVNVDTLRPLEIKWANVKYHSNNATYKMLVNICYLALKGLLPSSQDGVISVPQFKEEHLHRLFEKFVLEYYRKHYPQYNAKAAKINWIADDGITDLLPTMKSDITLEHNGKTLIIDTKYYSRTLQSHGLYDSQTIHSRNLYQIFAYVKNKDIHNTGSVSGVLLYAKTNEPITLDNTYQMSGNKISVKTLDLDQNFNNIKTQLDRIITDWES
ncbi:MAG: 5-methylcytosine-specific restriction endonuclease system specificity protein McrC [Defluviitaleaceae bacterium]|nr:5-methylcytosine-specific restriction endonuclease system specificity protein McrC [Defluviitaleaceae bacterium]